ncbi:hypothetical protein C1I98_20460 [Spongiactinospora gelatinilytica]|uniref:Uncharacterized protein n=1 Tax=Spongiactinospora gelatinilytica TaxID=2666298 RepID=A0A2W2GPI3_9ACTN|nr:hypothetical protein [Spongiactinospora gelatinilytica]PZG41995.1 hypothetical protein C1I98_20460 [Spongiactinospora gelatinilytica]
MTGEEEEAPIGQALNGLNVYPLPQGWTALAAIVLVKCLDEEGRSTWAFRTTDGLNDEELLGALTVRTDLLRHKLYDAYTSDADDE